jgi:hypothetical protein
MIGRFGGSLCANSGTPSQPQTLCKLREMAQRLLAGLESSSSLKPGILDRRNVRARRLADFVEQLEPVLA